MYHSTRVLVAIIVATEPSQYLTYSAGYGVMPSTGTKKYGTSTCWITHHACTNRNPLMIVIYCRD